LRSTSAASARFLLDGAGELELVEALPLVVDRVLDLGCGDGRLLELILAARPDAVEGIGVDNSQPMIGLARNRFGEDRRATIREHDLVNPLPDLGRFDAVVSGFAIHHLTHERKQALFGEVVDVLQPGGVFANLEVVQCATAELHAEFGRRIERPGGDPEDVLAEVEAQLGWMRAAGLEQVELQLALAWFRVTCRQQSTTGVALKRCSAGLRTAERVGLAWALRLASCATAGALRASRAGVATPLS